MNRFEMEPLEPLEPRPGVRTASSGTERILIGLAMLALLGGVVVGVANLLHVDFEAAASESPHPSGEASSTPRPTPEPRPRDQFVLEPMPSGMQEPQDWWPEGHWIRTNADLQVHGSPSLDTAIWSTLRTGRTEQTRPSGVSWDDSRGKQATMSWPGAPTSGCGRPVCANPMFRRV